MTLSDADSWYQRACSQLSEGALKGRHPYHLMVAANVDAQGMPQLRTVVLRGFDAQERRIIFHTDQRSPKYQQLAQHPHISLLFYDPKERLQLRFEAQVQLHHKDALCRRQWDATREDSKSCYLAAQPSGAQVVDSTACGVDAREFLPITPEADAQAFSHFAVLACHYRQLDMVQLAYEGHQRLQLRWHKADAPPEASWRCV